jgi:UDPglucose 6-dehydrogenase
MVLVKMEKTKIMKIGIIGYGHVGKAMHKLFTNAVIYDLKEFSNEKEKINECEAVFVCVPTPSLSDGSCDTKIVEEVISWVKAKVIILRSTVRVGFTDEMMKKYKKEIVFQPEYYGETVAHPFADIKNQNWLSFGGTRKGVNLAIRTYKTVINSNTRIFQADAKTVEMAKYMENAYLATKVIFCNEMYDVAESLGVDYNLAREIWLADPRIGSSHTFVYEDNRGFGGNCLPKDVASIIAQAEQANVDISFLKSVYEKNKRYRK